MVISIFSQFFDQTNFNNQNLYFLALKCYQCDSSKDEYCPETWDRYDIEPAECDHIDYPAFCVKTTGIYGAIVGNRRFCSSRQMDNSCNEVNFAQDPRTYYSCIYTCYSDGCNSALLAKSSKLSLFLASILSITVCIAIRS